MDKWFPQLKQTEAGKDARLRLVTFPNSGSAENVYTGADKTEFGGAKGRRDNALMKWAKSAKVEVWAAQPPGRDTRMREDCLGSAKEIAAECFAVCEKGLFEGDAPWALFAHSMGTWAAYEFALLCRAKGHRAPSVFVASGFPSPSCATADRPWTPNAGMDEDAFKAECRGWSINEVIFSPSMWKMRGPPRLRRARAPARLERQSARPARRAGTRSSSGPTSSASTPTPSASPASEAAPLRFPFFRRAARLPPSAARPRPSAAARRWTGENAALAFPVRGFYGTDDKRATKEKARNPASARDTIDNAFPQTTSEKGPTRSWGSPRHTFTALLRVGLGLGGHRAGLQSPLRNLRPPPLRLRRGGALRLV